MPLLKYVEERVSNALGFAPASYPRLEAVVKPAIHPWMASGAWWHRPLGGGREGRYDEAGGWTGGWKESAGAALTAPPPRP